MAVTETTTTSYGSNVKGSLNGMGMGLFLFCAGTYLLWWNEGRAVKTAQMLEEAHGAAVHVENVATYDPSLTGQLIHATSQATTNDVLTDREFGVNVPAIKLSREVEYYQYVESSSSSKDEKFGGSTETTTTYTCEARWTSSPVKSSSFHGSNATQYANKVLITMPDMSTVAQNVTFGAYTLTTDLVRGINGNVPCQLDVPKAKIDNWNATISRTEGAGEYVSVNGNTVYFGKNYMSPQIGDVRVTLTQVNPGLVTVLAQVNGNTFEEFRAKNGKTLSIIRMGNVSMDRIFAQEEEDNDFMLIVWRIVGFFVVSFGLKSLLGLLSTIFKLVPFLASVLDWGIGLISKVVGFVWTLLVVAVAWVFYRPLVAIGLLAVAGAVFYFFYFRGKGKGDSQTQATAPATTPTEPQSPMA